MRLRILEKEFGAQLSLSWRAFLLRPSAEQRPIEKFRRYTRSWQRVAEDTPAGEFRQWATEERPPTHSVPPHLVAKAAEQLGKEAFHAVHDALMKAYFFDNRDVSAEDTLKNIWASCGLPDAEFARSRDPELLETVLREHNEALAAGASGAPAFRMADQDVAVMGALPVATLQRWVSRALAKDI